MIYPTKEKQAGYGLRKLSLYLFLEVEHVSPGKINNARVLDHDVM